VPAAAAPAAPDVAAPPPAPEAETPWVPVETDVAAPDFIGASGTASVLPELDALPEAPDLERALGLDGAPPGPVTAIAPEDVSAIEEPEDGAGTGSAGSAISSPTSTAAGRPSRQRRPGGRRRGAPGTSRRIAGFGLVIVIPAVAAMLVGGGPDAGAAEAGVAGALSTPSVAPATPTPLVTPVPPAGVDPAIVPIGDDHGTAGPPIGTAIPTYGPTSEPNVLPTGEVAGQVATGSVSIVTRGPADRDVVALTFDDGYAPANVRAIFEMLVREDVKATFFINGYYLSRDPALWKEIAAAGFPVGNHTYYHVDIRTLSPEAIATELKMTSNAWKRVTGTRMIPYFRPPYGAHDAASDAAVAAAGYEHIVMWDTSSADTKAGISESQAIAGALSGGPGSIVLLHAGPDITPRILQAVIDGYRERGFEFVTIPELLGS
jgi:peptidoglycan/xylan/chitin deacetylase (PgdA/CDA1 family)